jgi:phosphotransferase system enzyme I (PtsP)
MMRRDPSADFGNYSSVAREENMTEMGTEDDPNVPSDSPDRPAASDSPAPPVSPAPPDRPEPRVQVHHRGDRGVDGILRLIELASHDGALETMLSAMCAEVAAIASVDIVSVYVREHDRLVMRGNHGFPSRAIGAVALGIGEGITGLVAECLRPVSAAHAAAETAYKHVPDLGEERFPVFVGVPLIGGGAAIGVLVLQRRAEPFGPADVTLATALGAPVTLAIERRRESAVRSARLTGIPQVGGAVLGRVAVVPTATAFDAAVHAPAEVRIERAFARLREDLSRTVRRLGDATEPAIGGALDRFALALCDARLRERLAAVADQPAGLRTVAKEYARAPYLLGGSRSEAADHAAEFEELCALLGDARGLRPGTVWIADRLSTFAAITAVARGAAALVASDVISLSAIAIARAASLPTISDVAGLFGWARPGDLLAVDGDRGTVLVHPSPSDIERLRRAR